MALILSSAEATHTEILENNFECYLTLILARAEATHTGILENNFKCCSTLILASENQFALNIEQIIVGFIQL